MRASFCPLDMFPSSVGRMGRVLCWFSICAAAVCIFVGGIFLFAWMSGRMGDLGLRAMTLKTNAALALLLSGVGLMLLTPRALPRLWKLAGLFCALSVLLIGSLTFSENIFGWDLGIDQLLAREPVGTIGVSAPNRMGTPASLSFTLAGAALLALSRRTLRPQVMQALALGVVLTALLGLIGVIYEVQQMHAIARITSIAWPTSLSLFLLGAGILCARPSDGIMTVVTADDSAGGMIRRLLLASVLMPLLLGYLRLIGERRGLYDSALGTGLVILLFIVGFSATVYFTGRSLRRGQEALRQSERRHRDLAKALELERSILATAIANIPMGIGIADASGTTLTMNRAALQLHGFDSEKDMRSSLDDYVELFELTDSRGERIPPRQWPAARAVRGDFVQGLEVMLHNTLNDTRRVCSYSAAPVRSASGDVNLIVYAIQDLTEHKRAEQQIVQSLKEKETLLQEIHHRVKNNMQVVNGLLNLQAANIKEEKLKEHFREASSRINSMALIHNILYESDSLSAIDFKLYVERLAGSLLQVYNARGVQLRVNADHLMMSMDEAIPCGLIINELISNALKYAFAGRSDGLIMVEAGSLDEEKQIELMVGDDGVGLPETIDVRRTQTLGLKLVLGLAESQLGGTLAVQRAHGTRYIIRFPRYRE